MKQILFVSLFLLVPPVLAQEAIPRIPFDSVPKPPKLPRDIYFGQITGVALTSQGHVFVLSLGNTSGAAYAAAAAQLLGFAPDGRFIREIGRSLYARSFAYTVRVDKGNNNRHARIL